MKANPLFLYDRRVRDRLIQDDRFGLAIETSTKCSIEIASVWSAWGMACLKNGHFKDAREKFQTCFKVKIILPQLLKLYPYLIKYIYFLDGLSFDFLSVERCSLVVNFSWTFRP